MQYLSKTESHPSHTRTLRVTPNPQPLCEAGGVTQTHNVGQEVSPKTTMWGRRCHPNPLVGGHVSSKPPLWGNGCVRGGVQSPKEGVCVWLSYNHNNGVGHLPHGVGQVPHGVTLRGCVAASSHPKRVCAVLVGVTPAPCGCHSIHNHGVAAPR